MTEDEIKEAVVKEYGKFNWPVRVTQTVPDTFGGTLAVIKGQNDKGGYVEEMCFVFENGKVQIFESTEQLAVFLDSRTKLPWYQRVFAPTTLSGIVFLLSIILVFVAGLLGPAFPDKASAVLGAVVGAAAGFYFGASKTK